ncbi:hypothetical protein CMT89_09975 [Elizabethkingia anophelis]|uniref:coiled-coil domain-containing protein n=1 Tax=Elizabethkingia anophelis TaxID=1117645 RepID=UPI000CE99AFD|nr:hypothetical protein [Elizabethkingia anophelis]AVF46938.1 hypothetical protein AL491_02110 [Elizabethkingia anophelis]AVF50928.1 hypothetical protein AL492_04515 [Elizabethkingia anophelis]MDV3901516.1 hypothetical protein [Elizabethkingia anophelis]MDV4058042.1 hypothetical protein [Elizabethkingia anophelis]HDP3253603.1 hypothetical protein [Elizabethkingia anophelis]
MKEIFLSVFKSSEERLKNPFIGTFILSFLILNWKPLAILFFSTLVIEQKINYIMKNYNSIWNIFIYPCIISIFYIGILPYLMLLFDKGTFWALKNRNKNLYNIKKIDIEGKTEIAQAEIELENLKSNYKEKADLNRKILELNSEIEINNGKIENLVTENNHLRRNINDYETSLNEKDWKIQELRSIVTETDNKLSDYYSDFINTPESIIYEFVNSIHIINRYLDNNIELNTQRKSLIERFLSLGLIEYINDKNNGQRKFSISDKGLYFIKKAYQEEIV